MPFSLSVVVERWLKRRSKDDSRKTWLDYTSWESWSLYSNSIIISIIISFETKVKQKMKQTKMLLTLVPIH